VVGVVRASGIVRDSEVVDHELESGLSGDVTEDSGDGGIDGSREWLSGLRGLRGRYGLTAGGRR
jgi:hypothetical protein